MLYWPQVLGVLVGATLLLSSLGMLYWPGLLGEGMSAGWGCSLLPSLGMLYWPGVLECWVGLRTAGQHGYAFNGLECWVEGMSARWGCSLLPSLGKTQRVTAP
jgi:hypothetical protein